MSTLFAEHPVSCRERGFTLIEILLALVLLSVVLGALYSTFFLSQRALEGMDDTLVKMQECRMTLDMMRRELDSLVYSTGNKYTLFKVEDRDLYGKQASRLLFSSHSPLAPGLSSLSYYVEEQEGKKTLLKKRYSSHEKPGEEKGMELIEEIEAFSVEVREGGGWVRTWNAAENGKVPEEIRITVTVMIKDKKLSLSETVRPKIGSVL
ncbi:MAG: type II secretion system protein GspJ [Alphaproteobacteria bacterium]|uniref:Type II secretion system protein GspJ n=1 Tax=Candidatus Nitrobium versatile TaxID=2884831 RepID=A0A953J959_9BACT|nr:type II secretion system protein GspJ [Candidatus Nitrobium versatile]